MKKLLLILVCLSLLSVSVLAETATAPISVSSKSLVAMSYSNLDLEDDLYDDTEDEPEDDSSDDSENDDYASSSDDSNDAVESPVTYDDIENSSDNNTDGLDLFDQYHAADEVGDGSIIAIDEDLEEQYADEPIEFDPSYEYIIFDDPLYFEDNDYYPVTVEYTDYLVSIFVDWEYDSQFYPYKAIVRTRGGNLNLRSAPSTDATIIGHLENGTIVLVIARSSDLNWAYVVASDGRQGFVYNSYLTTVGLNSVRNQESKYRSIYFTAVDLDGNGYISDEIFSQYRAVMINNWATWCTYCKEELEELERISKEMAGYNCAIIGIVRDATDPETIAQAKELLAEHGVTYLNLQPFDGVDELFPMEAYPTSFFVDFNGNLLGNPIEGAEIDQYIYRFYDIIH